MNEKRALKLAEQILVRKTVDAASVAELHGLESEFPGVSAQAAQNVISDGGPPPAESSACESVSHWADIRWSVEDIVRPEALSELVQLLTMAVTTKSRIRMVGAARSDSLVSTPGQAELVASCALDQVLPVLTDALAEGVDPNLLYRCESGRTAKEVIDDLQSANLALANMGAGQFQGIVGAIMTATHGSGLTLPDMSGLTLAMQVVTVDEQGEVVVQQFARNGIFDPTKFAAAVAGSPIRIELVEDEDAFLAAVVSMGCTGLVYSVMLQAVPQYWLHETRTVERWSVLKPQLLQQAAAYRNFEVLVNPLAQPYADAGGQVMDHECLVTRRALVNATEPSGSRPLTMAVATTAVGHLAAGVTLIAATRQPLKLVPFMLKTGVTSTVVKGYTNISRKVLQLNLDINAVGSELEVPVDRAVEATERLLAMAAANWQSMNARLQGHENPVHTALDALLAAWREVPAHTSPISLRFVHSTDAMLSMAHGGTRCMIEMPMSGSSHYDAAVKKGSAVFQETELKVYEAYLDGRNTLYRATETALRAAVGARPHWGLVNFITGDEAAASYECWEAWLARYQVANQHGVFNGPFTDQLGISVDPSDLE